MRAKIKADIFIEEDKAYEVETDFDENYFSNVLDLNDIQDAIYWFHNRVDSAVEPLADRYSHHDYTTCSHCIVNGSKPIITYIFQFTFPKVDAKVSWVNDLPISNDLKNRILSNFYQKEDTKLAYIFKMELNELKQDKWVDVDPEKIASVFNYTWCHRHW
jgi:hypothetical protein